MLEIAVTVFTTPQDLAAENASWAAHQARLARQDPE